jgi:hypothetical protein
LGTIEKHTLQAVLSNSFFDGETVVDAIEIKRDEINGVGLQESTYSKNITLVNPNITGLPEQLLQALGSKPKSNPSF